MAQPTAVQYLGTVRFSADIAVTSDSIITKFGVGTNAMQIKLDHMGDTNNFVYPFVSVSINNNPMFHFYDGDYCALIAGQSFVFDKAFTAAIGKYVAI